MPGERDDLERAAVLADFLHLVHGDRRAGGIRPLAHYLARFPGHETTVAEEYAALEARRPDEAVLAALEARGYHVVAELGRGAQGAVYLADELELGRRVAVKVLSLPLGLVPPGRLARLQREAALLARIDHPGVCAIHRAHLDAHPPFVVMRHVRGATLAQILVGTGGSPGATLVLPPRDERELARVLVLFEAAATALAAAHAAGVVHRDVKPSNILVGPDGHPVLVDFGIARALEDHERGLTRTGEVFGTPAYMSPEQLDAADGALDARTDVYSLGVTLFECLTARRPFEAPSQQRLEQAIRLEPVPRASRLNHALPRDLDVVLATAMEKDRTRRYSSAAELAADLARVRERRPVAARPTSLALRLRRWCQRNPVIAASLLLMGLSALGLSLATVQLLGERARTRAALRVSESRNLASQAVKDVEIDPLLALEEALEAHSMAPGRHSRDALYATIGVQRIERIYPQRAVAPPDLVPGVHAPDASRWIVSLHGGRVVIYSATGATEPVVLGGSQDVASLALAPDARSAAVGEMDGRVTLHDLARGTQVTLAPHAGPVSVLCFAPDGTLASGGEDGRVRLHARDGIRAELDLGYVVGGLRFSPGGEWVLAWPGETRQRLAEGDPVLLDAADGSVLARLAGHAARIDEVAFAAREPWLAVADTGGSVHVWEVPDGRLRHALAHPGKVLDVAFSPDDRHLATAFDPGAPGLERASGAWVFSTATGARELELRGHESRAVASIDWSPDGTRLVTGSYDGTARVWSSDDGRELSRLRLYEGLIFEARFIGAGDRLLVRQSLRSLVVRAAEWDPAVLVAEHSDPALCAAFDPEGVLLATGDAAGLVHVRDLRAGASFARFSAGTAPVRALAFVAGGTELLVASDDGACRVLALASGASRSELRLGEDPVEHVVVEESADTYWAACGTRIVRADLSGAVLRELPGEARVTCLDLSPDGRRLASGGDDRTVRVWDTASGACTAELSEWLSENSLPSLHDVFDVAFSPAGDRLLVATDDGIVRCYRVPTGTTEWSLNPGPRSGRIAWVDEGRALLTARWLGQTRVIEDALSGAGEVLSLEPKQAGLPTAQALSPDRTRLLVSSTSGRTLLWDLGEAALWAAVGDGRSPVLHAGFAPDGSAFVTTQADGRVLLRPLDVEGAARRALPEVVEVP